MPYAATATMIAKERDERRDGEVTEWGEFLLEHEFSRAVSTRTCNSVQPAGEIYLIADRMATRGGARRWPVATARAVDELASTSWP
jgi:hypothetical protein